MEYLFKINKDNASEIHEILGFVDADFTIVQLLPYLRKSTKEIIKYIGSENYQKAVDLFDEYEEPKDEFLIMMRYAIALGAFRLFMPLSDVSYTTYGRVFRSEEYTKAAFEWMLDRSDDALERSYYASINEIFDFIIDNDDYEATPMMDKIKNLYVSSIEIFEEFVKIDNSYALFFNLIPSLVLAEKRIIKPRIGTLAVAEKNNIISLVQHICVYFAMVDGMRKNSLILFPRGILKETSGKSKHSAVKQFDIEASVLHYNDEINKLTFDLETEIRKEFAPKTNVNQKRFEANDGFVNM